jgi:multidrug efflux pump subunit AcrB
MSSNPSYHLGLSGHLTRAFIRSPLTPLLLFLALLLGGLALMVLPREEEPQISVPMVDIILRADGLKAPEVEELVTRPLEDIVKGIDGVEHVYSQTQDDRVIVTARFFVGTDEDTATLRIHEHIRANYNRIPIGIPEPLIVGRGINDVAVLVLTLAPKPGTPAAERWTDNGLYKVATDLQHELVKVDNVGQTYIVGGRPDQIRVEPDPEKLSLYGVTLNQLVDKIRDANRSLIVGSLRQADRQLPVVAGQTLAGVPDIGLLLITTHDGRPVYVKDLAKTVVGASPEEHQQWNITAEKGGGLDVRPAVSVAFAKRKGANAVVVSSQVLERLAAVQGKLVPDSVQVTVTRDYGKTAQEKADELLFHLMLATLTIVALIALFIGWREGLVVAIVIPTTILLTFFAASLMGYTINRVSLFALIFSIGILVDDAIVVIENIVRHWHMKPGRDRVEVAIGAVAEVGNPTIIATLTIVAALLPMMFVSGLMGPYMSPIPANASAAMLFSFFVAVVIAPWLMLRLGRPKGEREGGGHGHDADTPLGRLYRRLARPVLRSRGSAFLFLALVGIGTAAACSLFYTKTVTVKLLPFDNKSEVQVVLDLPRGSSLEATQRTLLAAARRLADLPELTSMQAFAGTAAPFNFNGLVRHYYLRQEPQQGDLMINLLPKAERSRASHEIALDIRNRLKDLGLPPGSALKVVEVPPGPPVLSTLLAEIYGPSAEARREAAAKIRKVFESVPFIVDTDDSFGKPVDRIRFTIDQDSLEFYGVEQQAVYDTLNALLGGVAVGYSHRGEEVYPVEIAIRLPKSDLTLDERLLSTPVPSAHGTVELGDVLRISHEPGSWPLFRRDGHYAEMVTADLAGEFEAPIYGMFGVQDRLDSMDWGAAGKPVVSYHGQPTDETHTTLLWDGEWEITYVTFRDMGAAFGVAILAIYLLIVAEFRSFTLPLVIMTPIPLTLIGIVLGHWLFHAPFTATSMIGFISLAGIIVRNSILLVDFIRHERADGKSLRACLLSAGAIRVRPILLTALAAMVGAGFILLDPIFQGLAISLLFGLASSTLLTLLVIPAIYVVLRDDGVGFPAMKKV